MKLTSVTYAHKRIFPIENGIHKDNVSCTEKAKFVDYLPGLSVFSYSISRKCSSIVFNLMYSIHVYYGMFRFENDVHIISGSCTETHKSLKKHYSQWVLTFKRAFYHV